VAKRLGRLGFGRFTVNYRHAYHAGNFADVYKHVVLALIAEALGRKEAPFCAIDTHAGVGRYDLQGEEAAKTGEAADGVLRLVGKVLPYELGPYWRAVKSINRGSMSPRRAPASNPLARGPAADQHSGSHLRWYPGSPRVLRAGMRESDRLLLAELHPEDVAALRAEFAGDGQVTVRAMDGYAALKALLPPAERRGVVLIDPPFEDRGEFARLQQGLSDAWRRWPTGTYLIWYPIKARAPVDAFLGWVKEHAPAETLIAELSIHDGYAEDLLNGCGLVIVNPPWKVDQQFANVLPFLHATLRQTGGGSELRWLVREKDRAK
jgi:23S rRNA (adenine2030-N6)-methyltransferase